MALSVITLVPLRQMEKTAIRGCWEQNIIEIDVRVVCQWVCECLNVSNGQQRLFFMCVNALEILFTLCKSLLKARGQSVESHRRWGAQWYSLSCLAGTVEWWSEEGRRLRWIVGPVRSHTVGERDENGMNLTEEGAYQFHSFQFRWSWFGSIPLKWLKAATAYY